MGKFLAQLLGAAACVAVGFALGRMTVEKAPPAGAPAKRAGGTTASTGRSPRATPSLPTPKGTAGPHTSPAPPVAGPPDGPAHHDHDEHDIPAPEIAPLPDDVQGPLRDLLTALHDAVRKSDPDGMTEAQRKLSEWVGADAERALALIGWFKREEDPSSLNIVMAALTMDPRMATESKVVAAFLEVARRDPSSNRRMEALSFLGQGAKRDAEVERELLRLSGMDADPSIRVAAIVALRQQIDVDPSVAQRYNPEFLAAASASNDPAVRQQALQAMRMREAQDDQVRGVASFLRQDQDPAVRITAAEQLGEVRARDRATAITALSEGFRTDSQEDVRRACVLALVKAGRGEAVQALRGLHGLDPRLDEDIADYVQILERGEVDLDVIFEEKGRLEQARSSQNSFDPPTDR